MSDDEYGYGPQLSVAGTVVAGLVLLVTPVVLLVVRRTRWIGVGILLPYVLAVVAIVVVGLFFWVIYNA